MKNQYLVAATKQVPNLNILVNLVSRRMRQLAAGQRALTVTTGIVSPTDIALKEIAEGKLGFEMVDGEQSAKKKK